MHLPGYLIDVPEQREVCRARRCGEVEHAEHSPVAWVVYRRGGTGQVVQGWCVVFSPVYQDRVTGGQSEADAAGADGPLCQAGTFDVTVAFAPV